MIDKNVFNIKDIDSLNGKELEKTFKELNEFNMYIYNFVISYYKYTYKTKNYGTKDNYSMLEAHIITDIAENPGITANLIAKKWDKTPAFISQSLTKLEDRGLIERKLNKNNRKFYNLFLTDNGKKFDEIHKKYDIKSIINTNKKLMEKFSLDELIKLRVILEEYGKIILEEDD